MLMAFSRTSLLFFTGQTSTQTPHPVQSSGATWVAIGRRCATRWSVVLYERPYPYRVRQLVGSTLTAANGSFSFIVFPDRDARYSATLVGTGRARSLAWQSPGVRSPS